MNNNNNSRYHLDDEIDYHSGQAEYGDLMAYMDQQFGQELRQESRLKCPVCNYDHEEVDMNATTTTNQRFQPPTQHLCSHGANMIFTKADCPVCMEDQIGPPVVSLPCGHVVCVDDFERLGGRTGEDAKHAPQSSSTTMLPHGPSHNRMFSLPGAVSALADEDNDAEESSGDSSAGMPPLVHRTEVINDSSSSDDDDDMPPPLLPRAASNNNDSFSSSDDDDDDDDLPPLVGRAAFNNDDSSSDDDDSQEQLAERERQRRIQEERERQRRIQAEEEERQRQVERKRRKEAEKRRKQKARRKIFAFLQTQWYRKVAMKDYQTSLTGFQRLQAVVRANQIRSIWGQKVKRRLELARQYRQIWNPCLQAMPQTTTKSHSWLSFWESLEFVIPQDEDEAVNRILEEATEKALGETEHEDSSSEDSDDFQDALEQHDEATPLATTTAVAATTTPLINGFSGTHTSIMYTDTVMKWLKTRADGKYRGLFVKRIQQLSRGERSRILAKRLKGCKNTIYETYLEQKSGKRILWSMQGTNLLVWYVANHDNVSRLVKLIDDSQNRSQRQLVSASDLIRDDNNNDQACSNNTDKKENQIVLNPFGNTPMKVYEVSLTDVGEVAGGSWVPKLKLTDEERDVVETRGTVLLLGRSGTGKTICTANRMDYDRQLMSHDPSFSQLFVARSKSLCTYVKNAIGSNSDESFTTYDELKDQLEAMLPKVVGIRDQFPGEREMRLYRFKKEVYDGDQGVDPLLVWTSIRSFIKGSIEATQSSSTFNELCKEDFLNFQKFGAKRCRLVLKQRQIVYRIYESYVKYMKEKGMWDECDRILALLTRLEGCKTSDPDLYQRIKKSKIYVDEVQDYTQAECLLFFYLTNGQGNLFLAGDPAQNVEEGVEFRFEDIRSVEYHIAKDRSTVMEKPKIVSVNFRSHAGVLNTAGAILSCMFEAFPNSAKQLKEDHGIFVGPRPGVFEKVEIDVLKDLLVKKLDGAVVLVHGSSLKFWKEALPEYGLIRSIEASKGLEFKSVILLDFFADLSKQTDVAVQKAWRDLLIRGASDDFDKNFPEIEGQLKRLYTGVTRCIERLFFVETKETMAGNAFVRWLTTTSTARNKKSSNEASEKGRLATKNKVVDIESQVMTRDEALKSGMKMAAAAEARGRSDLSASREDLNQAIYYFDLADDKAYEKKALLHLESLELKSNLPPIPTRSDLEDEALAVEYQVVEADGARIVERLMKESLLLEARDLCTCILPYLSTLARKRLRQNLIVALDDITS